jgi:Rps23 Pro-64 3,4-dihydroxylase Tpa1-like proline 4-hydroxylase
MTSKQLLDSFSETLMRDDRILSARERELLSNLLQHANAAVRDRDNEQTQDAVRKVIASAVGETVAQRAFAVLGGSIVEHILEQNSATQSGPLREKAAIKVTPGVTPPSPGPQPPATPVRVPGVPAPSPGPQPPATPFSTPGITPPSPGPQPPAQSSTTSVSKGLAALQELPSKIRARSVVLDEFLAPQEVAELMRFTIEHESDFQASEVVCPTSEHGVVNYDHRRSRVLMDLGRYQDLLVQRIKTVLPQVLEKLGMPAFEIAGVEAQITSSNDGDYFHFHSDNGNERVASRHLTFVYFFHREPKQFEGGELRIHDAHLEEGLYLPQGSYQTVSPRQNQIVFFPCETLHEITPVKCKSQAFADSRFTLNGWLRR